MAAPALRRKLAAEFFGTGFLLAAVVGSGIMGERLAAGNEAMALLANTVSTAAMLVVLITMLAPVSGAHLNPAVTAAFLLRRDIAPLAAAGYVAAQVSGAVAGVLAAHAMFDLPLLQLSAKARSGLSQGVSEWVATSGLVATILMTLRARPDAVAASVGLYIAAAYWFTASTSFANPAATVARALSDTFAGIDPADVPVFIAAQLAGAVSALALVRLLCGRTGLPESESGRLPGPSAGQ